MSIATLFHKGGMTMLWITALVVPTLVIALFHLAAPRRWAAWVGLSLVAVVLAIGAYGTLIGRSNTDAVLDVAPDIGTPDEREEMRAMGYSEASLPIEFAGGVAVLALVALGIGQLRRPREAA